MNDEDTWPMSFAEVFCHRYRCAADTYEAKVFWRCFANRWSVMGRLVDFLSPEFFREDQEAIRRLGVARNVEDFMRELDDLDYVTRRRGGFLRLKAGMRVSVQRLDRLQARLFPRLPPKEGGDSRAQPS